MFKNLEDHLTSQDMDILEMKELKNDLEAYLYNLRSNIDSYGPWEKYIQEEIRGPTIAEVGKEVDWIYDAGETAPK